jgi:ABC-type nitrate/sulfonate/bicarbonate transport system permease component
MMNSTSGVDPASAGRRASVGGGARQQMTGWYSRGQTLLNFLFRHEKKIIGTTSVLLFLITWELAAAYRLVNPIFLSSPMRVWNAAANLAETGELWMHMQVSGVEFFVGYFISAIVGVPLGICLGWYRRFNYAFDPFVNALYAAPRVAFLPLIVIWIGIGFGSKLALVILSGIFPILMNSRDAVKTTPHHLLEAAQSFQASQWQVFKTIVLPSSVPFIVAGLRLGAGRALIGVFVAELYVAQAGVGYMITQAGATFKTDIVLVGVIIFSATGMLVLEGLSQFEKRFDKWRPPVGAHD